MHVSGISRYLLSTDASVCYSSVLVSASTCSLSPGSCSSSIILSTNASGTCSLRNSIMVCVLKFETQGHQHQTRLKHAHTQSTHSAPTRHPPTHARCACLRVPHSLAHLDATVALEQERFLELAAHELDGREAVNVVLGAELLCLV